jgi:hypothetical protein
MDKAEQQLEAMTRRWQQREISNVSAFLDWADYMMTVRSSRISSC